MRDRWVLERDHLETLLMVLKAWGYQPAGPVLRDGGIVYDVLDSLGQLPVGMVDEQAPGHYRLSKGTQKSLFGYGLGPHSWKQFLHPPRIRLYQVVRCNPPGLAADSHEAVVHWAFIGIRPCDLHAITIHDQVLLRGDHTDSFYRARREKLFLVAVNCTQAGGTCFCVSMGGGPQASSGFDLALTEVFTSDRHIFLVEIGSSRGADVLRQIPHREAAADEVQAAANRIARATTMGRTLDTSNLQELLYQRTEHPHWAQVADRCLTCGNCTLVCPTCFCTTVTDTTDVSGERAERWRTWDSCFSLEFSYIHGGPLRASAKARYRQWLTHKFATWIEQFGTLGCVGCGRCITWCPAGIDVTEALRRIREDGSNQAGPAEEK
jgi:sulfhydrogenase subunit beta (sulfur reductase)